MCGYHAILEKNLYSLVHYRCEYFVLLRKLYSLVLFQKKKKLSDVKFSAFQDTPLTSYNFFLKKERTTSSILGKNLSNPQKSSFTMQ